MSALISIKDNEVSITIDNLSLIKDPDLKIAMSDWQAEVSQDDLNNQAEIKISTQGLSDFKIDELYRDINNVFKGIGVELLNDNDTEDKIKKIQDEDAEFFRRSEAAHNVWKGNIDIPDFKSFSKFIQNGISRHFFHEGLDQKQLLSSYYLAATSCGCNFSVPGAGKTASVWAAYAYLNSLPKDDPRYVNAVFVIGPIACFGPWEDEYEKCFNKKAKSIRFLSSIKLDDKKNITKGITHKDTELYLSHFQTFTIYEELFKQLLIRPDKKIMLVVDEAHNIKGQDGVWANAALRLAPFANSRIILTGTPAPNGFEDLKNLFDFIHPNRNIIGFSRGNLRLMTNSDLSSKELNKRIKPFYIRIKKSELNIPPSQSQEIKIEMSPLQEKIYSEVESKFIKNNDQKLFKHGNLIRLRQAASNPLMLIQPLSSEIYEHDYDDESAKRIVEVEQYLKDFDCDQDLPKLDILINLVKEAFQNNEKILIWTYFVATSELIYKNLKKYFDISAIFKITGATPVNEKEKLDEFTNEINIELTRENIITEFKAKNGFSALVATPQCIGESISLHMECHKAVYFDRDFNCGLFIQSKDRIHRKGLPQNIDTKYYYLVTRNTVDEQINHRLDEKEKRMMRLIESDEIPFLSGAFDSESAEDIKSIIEAYYAKQL